MRLVFLALIKASEYGGIAAFYLMHRKAFSANHGGKQGHSKKDCAVTPQRVCFG